MKVKALVSFFGKATMNIGEVRELDKETALDLIKAGYVVEIKEPKKAKKTTTK